MGALQDWRTPRVSRRRPPGSVEGWLEKIPGRLKKESFWHQDTKLQSLRRLSTAKDAQSVFVPAIPIRPKNQPSNRGEWFGMLKSKVRASNAAFGRAGKGPAPL